MPQFRPYLLGSHLILLAAAAALLAAPGIITAAPIAADSFFVGGNAAAGEYDTSSAFAPPGGMPAQNPTIPGFAGPWVSSVGGTNLWAPVAGGLSHPSIVTPASGAARFQFDTEVGVRNVRRSLSSPPTVTTGDTFWMSVHLSLNANDPDFDGFAFAGFASDVNNNNSTQGLRVGVQGDGSEMDLVFRHRSGMVTAESLTLVDGITPGKTYLVLVRAQVNTDLGGGGVPGNDNISIWVNPPSVGSVASLGAPTLMVEDFSIFNNAAFSFLTFEGSNITGAGVLFDEPALGRNLSDVVTAVPEPASLLLWSLAGLGGLGAGWRRRRGLYADPKVSSAITPREWAAGS